MKIEYVEPVRKAQVTSILNTDEIAELLAAAYLLQDTADGLAHSMHFGHASDYPKSEHSAKARVSAAKVRHARIISGVVAHFKALADAANKGIF